MSRMRFLIVLLVAYSMGASWAHAFGGESGKACHAAQPCKEEYFTGAPDKKTVKKSCGGKKDVEVYNMAYTECDDPGSGRHGRCVGPGVCKESKDQKKAAEEHKAHSDHKESSSSEPREPTGGGGSPSGPRTDTGGGSLSEPRTDTGGSHHIPEGHSDTDGHSQAQHDQMYHQQQSASAQPDSSAGQGALGQAFRSGQARAGGGGGAQGGASGGGSAGGGGGHTPVSEKLSGGQYSSPSASKGDAFTGLVQGAELIAGFLRPVVNRDKQPIVIEQFTPVYLVSAQPHASEPNAPRVVSVRQSRSAPRDPNKPLTREEIFQFAQHDTGPYRGEGDQYYFPQSTFADAQSGTAADGSVRAYGSQGAPGFDQRIEEDPNAAPRGAPGLRGAVYRLLAGGGPTDSGASACSGFADCVSKGFAVVVENVAGKSSRAGAGEGGGTGDLGQEETRSLAADQKAACLRGPQECLRAYTGRGPQLPDATFGSTTEPISAEDLAAAITDPFNLPSYPQDTVVKACYDDSCLYGVTGIDHALDIDVSPVAFGVPTTTPLSLKPVAVFSTSAMAQAVAAILNGGFTLDIAIQQAGEDTGGRPLYVVPEGVAFAPPLSELQLRAFLFYAPPAPWAPGTSMLNIR